jgi:hypothetical protein
MRIFNNDVRILIVKGEDKRNKSVISRRFVCKDRSGGHLQGEAILSAEVEKAPSEAIVFALSPYRHCVAHRQCNLLTL